MKKIFGILAPVVLIIIMISGCRKNYSDLSLNTNKPTTVPPAILLTGVLNDMYDRPFAQTEVWDQYYLYNYDYYGNNRYDFGSGTSYYGTLKNVTKMEEEAAKLNLGVVNPYEALGKFFRAFFFTKMSLQFGDIPMTEALQGINNLHPVYDPQKQVFKTSLAWLDTANTELTSLINGGTTTVAGDIYYGGDLKKWRKAVNTFRLRTLIELSKKAADADLAIAQQFTAILGDADKYPIMESAADNLQYVYVTPSNFYPNNPSNFGFDGSRNNMSATHIGLLTQLNDPRVFVVAEPVRYYVDSLHQDPTSFDSFQGADPSEDLGVMYDKAGRQRYSFLNRKRYYSTFTGENSIQIGYAEMCFNIAEAINRGWVSGDAETWYMNGIQTSLAFYGVPTTGQMNVYFYRPGSTNVETLSNYDTYAVSVDWTSYYNQLLVKYAGDNATGLTQINQQKYLALFRHSGLEAYFNFRRTGVPVFAIGPGTGNSSRIAFRFRYPASEASANTENYNAALQSQFAGDDDINGLMWLLN